jgi:hypothetical protein
MAPVLLEMVMEMVMGKERERWRVMEKEKWSSHRLCPRHLETAMALGTLPSCPRRLR